MTADGLLRRLRFSLFLGFDTFWLARSLFVLIVCVDFQMILWGDIYTWEQ